MNYSIIGRSLKADSAPAQPEARQPYKQPDEAPWQKGVGFVGVGGLAYQYIIHPVANWIATVNDLPPLPDAEVEELMTMLGGMIGMGAIRTWERIKRA